MTILYGLTLLTLVALLITLYDDPVASRTRASWSLFVHCTGSRAHSFAAFPYRRTRNTLKCARCMYIYILYAYIILLYVSLVYYTCAAHTICIYNSNIITYIRNRTIGPRKKYRSDVCNFFGSGPGLTLVRLRARPVFIKKKYIIYNNITMLLIVHGSDDDALGTHRRRRRRLRVMTASCSSRPALQQTRVH